MAAEKLTPVAVIDLGTNTFNLLVARYDQGQLHILCTDKLPVLLGMGGINEGFIAPAAMQRAKDGLRKFYQKGKEWGVSEFIGIGTSALREAKNKNELVDFAKNELDISIRIVSGFEEAELIFNGVRLTFPFEENALVMDIGGGSTEFMLAGKEGLLQLESLNIGVSRLFQSLKEPLVFTSSLVEEVLTFLESKSTPEFNSMKSNVLIGSSGSFETFYELIHSNYFPKTTISIEIDKQALMTQLEWIIFSSYAERMSNDWIVPIRKKMLPLAAIKVKWMIEKFGIEQVFVSPFSLKEGAVVQYFGGE